LIELYLLAFFFDCFKICFEALDKLVDHLNRKNGETSHNFIDIITESAQHKQGRSLSTNSAESGSIMVINGIDDENEQCDFDDFGKKINIYVETLIKHQGKQKQ
jgi:hypothetical protein